MHTSGIENTLPVVKQDKYSWTKILIFNMSDI